MTTTERLNLLFVLATQEEQQYYETAGQIRVKPGWLQGEGQPLPKWSPTSGAGRRSSRW